MAITTTKPQKFSRLGFSILVHDNRIEIRDGLLFMQKRTVIPFKNISTVGVGTITKRLEITTNDGKTYKYSLGGFGKVQRCRDAIVANL
jgi:hypothetical protein